MKKISLFIGMVMFFLSCSTNNNNGTVTVIPLAPSNLTGTVISTRQINLSWTDNATNEDGYKIERKTGNGNFAVVGSMGADLTTYNDLGLTPNTSYTYRVYAYNSAGNSIQYSNEVTVSTQDSIPTWLTNGLVAYYPFNGNANDESGNGNNGTVNGPTLTTDRFGNGSKAYSFDGFNSINVAHQSNLNILGDLTISAWFLSQGPPTYRTSHTIVCKRSSTDGDNFPYYLAINYQYGIPSDYKKPIFVSSTSSLGYQYLQSTTDINNGVWNHLVSVITGSTIKIFLNGTLVLDTLINNSKRSANLANLLIGSGARPDLPAEQFIGSLDDIRIYNRALSQSEISYLATH